MNNKVKTTEAFIKKSNIVHKNRYDYGESKYINTRTPVIITCKIHGEFRQSPNHHLSGKGCPKCGSNKLTQREFIIKAKKIHGDKYDYSLVDYKNSSTKVTIICKIHGEFKQTPNNHLSGYNCIKCSHHPDNNDKFILKAEKIHKNKYDYSLVDYKDQKSKVKIICKKHGVFEQKPNGHLQGQGCPYCSREMSTWRYSDWEKAGMESNNFDGFKLYIIECWDNNERFYKIGKTFRKLHYRLNKYTIPYNYKKIYVVEASAEKISKEENKMLRIVYKNKYIPKKKFKGAGECFYIDNINDILP